MGVYVRNIRGYVCDRCGEKREVEGTEPVPVGWIPLLYGADVQTVISYAMNKTAEIGRTVKPDWLCVDCGSWLRKFLEGRKVAE